MHRITTNIKRNTEGGSKVPDLGQQLGVWVPLSEVPHNGAAFKHPQLVIAVVNCKAYRKCSCMTAYALHLVRAASCKG